MLLILTISELTLFFFKMEFRTSPLEKDLYMTISSIVKLFSSVVKWSMSTSRQIPICGLHRKANPATLKSSLDPTLAHLLQVISGGGTIRYDDTTSLRLPQAFVDLKKATYQL